MKKKFYGRSANGTELYFPEGFIEYGTADDGVVASAALRVATMGDAGIAFHLGGADIDNITGAITDPSAVCNCDFSGTALQCAAEVFKTIRTAAC